MGMRTLIGTIADLRRGQTTSLALTEAAIERHRRWGAALNAYRAFDGVIARKAARLADEAFAAGRDMGPLHGITVLVKDLFGVAGWPIYAGTARRLPAEWEAEGLVIQRLRDQLGGVVGKSHSVEFAIGCLGTNAHYGTPCNPWGAHEARVYGGSSSGAAVSLHEGCGSVDWNCS